MGKFERDNLKIERDSAFEKRLVEAIIECAADFSDCDLDSALCHAIFDISDRGGKLDPETFLDLFSEIVETRSH